MKNCATIKKRKRLVTRNIALAPTGTYSKPGPSLGAPSITTENMLMKESPKLPKPESTGPNICMLIPANTQTVLPTATVNQRSWGSA